MSFNYGFESRERESQFNTAGGSEFQVRGAAVLNESRAKWRVYCVKKYSFWMLSLSSPMNAPVKVIRIVHIPTIFSVWEVAGNHVYSAKMSEHVFTKYMLNYCSMLFENVNKTIFFHQICR